jgi:hypothetical protein
MISNNDECLLDVLPKEILGCITHRCGNLTLLLFSRTCKRFSHFNKETLKTDIELTTAYSKKRFEVARWLLDHNVPASHQTLEKVCRHATTLDDIKYFLQRTDCCASLSHTNSVVLNKNIQNKVEVLKYLQEFGMTLSKAALINAIIMDDVQLVEYLLESVSLSFDLWDRLIINSVQMFDLLLTKVKVIPDNFIAGNKEVYKHMYKFVPNDPRLNRFPLMHAIKLKDDEFVKSILSHLAMKITSSDKLMSFLTRFLCYNKVVEFLIDILQTAPLVINTEFPQYSTEIIQNLEHLYSRSYLTIDVLEQILLGSVRLDDVTIFNWCISKGVKIQPCHFELASSKNNKKIMQVTYDSKANYSVDVSENLAQHLNVKYLQLFVTNKQAISNKLVSKAFGTYRRRLRNGEKLGKFVKWIITNKILESIDYPLMMNIFNDDILKRIFEDSQVVYPNDLIDSASYLGNLSVYNYLKSLGQFISKTGIRYCMEKPFSSMEIVNDIITDRNEKFLQYTLKEAVRNDRLHIVKLLLSKGVVWTDNTTSKCIMYSTKSMIEWAINKGHISPTQPISLTNEIPTQSCAMLPVCLHCIKRPLNFKKRIITDEWLISIGLAVKNKCLDTINS